MAVRHETQSGPSTQVSWAPPLAISTQRGGQVCPSGTQRDLVTGPSRGSAPPTTQSHSGLAGYRDGDAVSYSRGEEFVSHRATLFPLASELEDWEAEMAAVNSSGTARIGAITVHAQPATTAGSAGRYADSEGQQRCVGSGLEAMHPALRATNGGWRRAAVVDQHGWVRIRRHPMRRVKAQPTFLVPANAAKGVDVRERLFPLQDQAPRTKRPALPPPPPEILVQEVKQTLTKWEDCVSEDARRALGKATALAATDEAVLGREPCNTAHRQRARIGEEKAEVRIGPDQYHPTVNKVLRQGYTIDLSQGPPVIRLPSPLDADAWGFNARKLIKDARAIGWPDEELLFFLEFGFMDYSGLTPPICSFSPHQQKAVRNTVGFKEQVRAEIDKGWLGPAFSHPPSVPFQVRPGSLEPKSDGRLRLVWNASWPVPGSRDSAVRLGNEWAPVAPNASTILPQELEFEWSAIEANSEAIAILAEGAKATGAPILGRTFDFKKWFRQLATGTLDLWKCTVFAEGGFREDKRMQMGRRSSAHSGQRTTFLLTEMLQRAAGREQWGVIPKGGGRNEPRHSQITGLQAWVEDRKRAVAKHTGDGSIAQATQASLVHFSSFQDDLTAIALGWDAARDATEGVLRILQGDYEVPLSDKEEANKDFALSFSTLGATYDMSDPSHIKCRPRDEKMEKYERMLDQLKQAYPLAPLQELQRFIGLHTFMSRFLERGEFFCNSAYCCLRATPHTSGELRPVSRDLIADAEAVLRLLRRQALAPLTADPIYAHTGLQGFSSDASGSAEASAVGWGVHVHGGVAKGRWSAEIKKALAHNKLSISPLELLASGIALKVALESHRLPRGAGQLIMRTDSASACAVANTMRADSAPMLEALRIFREIQDEAGIRIRLQFLPTGENRIADNLSRGRQWEAEMEAQKYGNLATLNPPSSMHVWYQRVLQAALQAVRHSSAHHSRTPQ